MPGTVIPRGSGYLYISQEVVDFRRDAPSIADVQNKMRQMEAGMSRQFGPSAIVLSSGIATPILMCEQGARRRKLDMETAAADAAAWWRTGWVPLRPTPPAASATARRSARPEVPAQDPQTLVAQLREAASPAERSAAAKALANLGAPAVEPLIAALKHQDIDACRAAARVLGRIGDPRAVEPLLDISLSYEPKPLKADCDRALLAIGEPAVKPAIAGLKRGTWNAEWGAADLLGRLGDPRAIKPLAAALDNPNFGPRVRLVTALGKIGHVQAVAPLARALKDQELRSAAAGWLVRYGEPAVEPLIAALEDEGARKTAAGALVKIGAPAIEPLSSALDQRDPVVRKAVADTLGRLAKSAEVEEAARQRAASALEGIDLRALDQQVKKEVAPKPSPVTGRGYNLVLIVGETARVTNAYQKALNSLVQQLASEPDRRLAYRADIKTFSTDELPEPGSKPAIEGYLRGLQVRTGIGFLAFEVEFRRSDGFDFMIAYMKS